MRLERGSLLQELAEGTYKTKNAEARLVRSKQRGRRRAESARGLSGHNLREGGALFLSPSVRVCSEDVRLIYFDGIVIQNVRAVAFMRRSRYVLSC